MGHATIQGPVSSARPAPQVVAEAAWAVHVRVVDISLVGRQINHAIMGLAFSPGRFSLGVARPAWMNELARRAVDIGESGECQRD
jgi:hypothetical protein